MYRSFVTGIAALAMAAAVTVGAQERTVMVGGAAMYPSKDCLARSARMVREGRAG